MIETPTPGTDHSEDGGTSPSNPMDHQRDKNFYAWRRSVTLMSEQQVQQIVQNHFNFFKEWLQKERYDVNGPAFEDVHAALAQQFGVEVRAMLYRTFLYYSAYAHHRIPFPRLPEGEEAVVARGIRGFGGSSIARFCEVDDADALEGRAAAFVDRIKKPTSEDSPEAMRQHLQENIRRLHETTRFCIEKVFMNRSDPMVRERAQREMRKLLNLDPQSRLASVLPHIVGGSFTEEDCRYLTMYDPGIDLNTLILAAKEKGTSLSWRTCADLCAHMARALYFFHDGGMIHLDVKPDNLLVRAKGDVGFIDFGTTKYEARETTDITRDDIHATFAYITPEHAAGRKVDIRAQSDVFQMGLTILQLFGAKTRMLFPDDMSDDTPAESIIAHRANLLARMETAHDKQAEWEPLNDIHFPKHLRDQAKEDMRLERYLDELSAFVWRMLHPIIEHRPGYGDVFTFFTLHSRFGRATDEFKQTGTVSEQSTRDGFVMNDPADPYPLLAKLEEESHLPDNLAAPYGQDVLDRFKEPARHGRVSRRRMRHFVAGTVIAGTALAGGIGTYLMSRPNRQQQALPGIRQPADAIRQPATETADRDLREPTVIVREEGGKVERTPPGYENVSIPIDRAIEFAEGALLSYEGHPRGFKLGRQNPFTRESLTYSIDHVRGDPSQETTMMILNVTENLNDVRELFPEAAEKFENLATGNAFLFCHGTNHLLLLPGGCGLLVQERGGKALSQRFTTMNASEEVRDLCAALLETEFKGYVVPSQPKNIQIESLLRDQKRHAEGVLIQYVRGSQ